MESEKKPTTFDGFKDALKYNIEKHCEILNSNLIIKSFPTLCRQNPTLVNSIKDDILTNYKVEMTKEMELMLEEENTESIMNEFEKIKSDFDQFKAVENTTPDQIVDSLMCDFLEQKKATLLMQLFQMKENRIYLEKELKSKIKLLSNNIKNHLKQQNCLKTAETYKNECIWLSTYKNSEYQNQNSLQNILYSFSILQNGMIYSISELSKSIMEKLEAKNVSILPKIPNKTSEKQNAKIIKWPDLIEKLLEDNKFPNSLADIINKTLYTTPNKTASIPKSTNNSQSTPVDKTALSNMIDQIENDPDFEPLFNLLNSKECIDEKALGNLIDETTSMFDLDEFLEAPPKDVIPKTYNNTSYANKLETTKIVKPMDKNDNFLAKTIEYPKIISLENIEKHQQPNPNKTSSVELTEDSDIVIIPDLHCREQLDPINMNKETTKTVLPNTVMNNGNNTLNKNISHVKIVPKSQNIFLKKISPKNIEQPLSSDSNLITYKQALDTKASNFNLVYRFGGHNNIISNPSQPKISGMENDIRSKKRKHNSPTKPASKTKRPTSPIIMEKNQFPSKMRLILPKTVDIVPNQSDNLSLSKPSFLLQNPISANVIPLTALNNKQAINFSSDSLINFRIITDIKNNKNAAPKGNFNAIEKINGNDSTNVKEMEILHFLSDLSATHKNKPSVKKLQATNTNNVPTIKSLKTMNGSELEIFLSDIYKKDANKT